MIHKKTLKAGFITKISSGESRYIKILNCQSDLRMTVTASSGKEVMSSEVRSGFEITLPAFQDVTLESEQEQRVEIWVSENRLGYEAPTKGSNSNASNLIEHYGGSQKVLPFERNRVAITLFSDSEPFWYGGQGVTVENGIPVAAGVAHKIEGAGELHIAVDIPADFGISGVVTDIISASEFPSVWADDVWPVNDGFIVNAAYQQNYKITKNGIDKVSYFDDLNALGWAEDLNGNIAQITGNKFQYKDFIVHAAALGASVVFHGVSYSGGKVTVCGISNGFAAIWELNEVSGQLSQLTTDTVSAETVYRVHRTAEGVTLCLAGANRTNTKLYELQGGVLDLISGGSLNGAAAIFSESDTHIGVSTESARVLLSKADLSIVSVLPSEIRTIYIANDKWVGLSSNEVFESVDNGASWRSRALIEGQFGVNDYSSRMVKAGDVFIVSKFNSHVDKATFCVLEQEKLLINPKAKIRMLKEVV